MEYVIGLVSGGVFGYALDKGKTNLPSVIFRQMDMQNWIMFRMFMAAAGTSTAALLISDTLGWTKREARTSVALGFGRLGGMGGNIVGGLLLGAGMAVSGSCPGTVYSQLAVERITSSVPVLLGGLAATILYGYFEKRMRTSVPNYQKRGEVHESDFAKHFGYQTTALLTLGMFGALLYGANMLFPWTDDMANVMQNFNPDEAVSLTSQYWDPALAGMLVGLLQFPMHVTSCAGALGMSSGYILVAANIARLFDSDLKENAPYLHRNIRNSHAEFQLIVGLGTFLGTLLSQYMSGYPVPTAAYDGVASPVASFIGGMMLLFGARMQFGCTSGMGLSGVATLGTSAVVSVASMFAGGMGITFLGSLVGLTH